jgi:membrane protein implicated in regulation of membrane protease activity
MIIAWWHWLALGLILVALELAASGGFYVIFFGIAAIAISVLHLVGAAGPAWVQVLLFSVLSVASLLFFRSPLMRWMKLDREGVDVDSLVGENAVATESIPAGGIGRIELRGTVWTARNAGATPLVTGQRLLVVRVEQLTIHVEAEGART